MIRRRCLLSASPLLRLRTCVRCHTFRLMLLRHADIRCRHAAMRKGSRCCRYAADKAACFVYIHAAIMIRLRHAATAMPIRYTPFFHAGCLLPPSFSAPAFRYICRAIATFRHCCCRRHYFAAIAMMPYANSRGLMPLSRAIYADAAAFDSATASCHAMMLICAMLR